MDFFLSWGFAGLCLITAIGILAVPFVVDQKRRRQDIAALAALDARILAAVKQNL